ncbi:unnamed protein product [Linum trigynum]|uniref:Uncharacterized protein n=1 Tax=Linum trigynum TaxID=586398 RepID=A0AAV2CJY3_9ROSI
MYFPSSRVPHPRRSSSPLPLVTGGPRSARGKKQPATAKGRADPRSAPPPFLFSSYLATHDRRVESSLLRSDPRPATHDVLPKKGEVS